MELNESLKKLLSENELQLKDAAKRRFMAQTVLELGYGGQTIAAQERGRNRTSIRKGIKELKRGIICVYNHSAKGRKKAEEHLPVLLENIKSLVDSQSQTDPSFKSQRIYVRLSAAQVREQLIAKYRYSDEDLASEETIRFKLNNLGYPLKRVAKVLPQKKFQKPRQSLRN